MRSRTRRTRNNTTLFPVREFDRSCTDKQNKIGNFVADFVKPFKTHKFMDYRGKCESKDKVRKDGQPKRSGNFSYATFHAQQLQSKDYQVKMVDGELIVGDHTPLMTLMPRAVVELAETDPHFGSYIQDGTQAVQGKDYEAHRRLIRIKHGWYLEDVRFILRMEIYTDGEVKYNFPEY